MTGERAAERTIALRCPACGGGLALPAGATVERCPSCDTALLLNVPGNVPRLSAVRRLNARDAWGAVRRWLRAELPPELAARVEPGVAHDLLLGFAILAGDRYLMLVGAERDGVIPPPDGLELTGSLAESPREGAVPISAEFGGDDAPSPGGR